jgi:hypothetical protein
MYNNRKKTPIKNWLLFGFILWTAILGFIWFADQGELVIMNRKYLKTRFTLDSINMERQKYIQTISKLKEDLQDIQTSMEKSEVKLNRLNNLYWIEKSKNDTTINANEKDNK